jgi:hypothetical protein
MVNKSEVILIWTGQKVADLFLQTHRIPEKTFIRLKVDAANGREESGGTTI